MSAKESRFYLDTNVILDVIEGRKPQSERILEKIEKENWYSCTSIFALCELIDIEQQFLHIQDMISKRITPDEILRNRRQKRIDEKQRQEAIDKVRNFIEKHRVEVFTISREGWDKTLEILLDCNVNAVDSVQIATAIEANCGFFLTSDSDLGGQAKLFLECLNPESACAKFL